MTFLIRRSKFVLPKFSQKQTRQIVYLFNKCVANLILNSSLSIFKLKTNDFDTGQRNFDFYPESVD